MYRVSILILFLSCIHANDHPAFKLGNSSDIPYHPIKPSSPYDLN